MPSDTIATPPFEPSLERLDRELTREWDHRRSRKDAVRVALALLKALERRSVGIDLARDFWFVWHAAEALWDAEMLEVAVRLVATWREIIFSVEKSDDVDCAEAYLWAMVLQAELEHRRRRPAAAVALADTVLRTVRESLGGRVEYEKLLKSGKVTAQSQLVSAALAIGIPSARLRFAGRPVMRAQYLDRWIADAKLMLGRDMPSKPLRRIHALVIQTYFAIAKGDRTDENRFWLDRLEKFDDLVRPASRRGQETRRLRLMVRCEFEGEHERAEAEARSAYEELENLPRHRKALEANGWWPKAANG